MPVQDPVTAKILDPLAGPYRDVTARIRALCCGETDPIALMATMACELFHSMEGFDWVGFYRVVGPETLKIGPYQGGHGCLVIPFTRGVCGAAARERRTQIVADVHAFPDHIACAASTRSEIVVPVLDASGRLIAVLDVDSDTPARFGADDAVALEALCREVFATAGPDSSIAAIESTE
jgi:GAF domain-containing protein